MTQKKNKKRNPMAIQLRHWRHQVIKNKKERDDYFDSKSIKELLEEMDERNGF